MFPTETGPPAGADSLHELIRVVGAATRIDDVFAAALTAVRDSLGVRRAALLLLDDDGVMRFRAWEGLSPGYRAAVEGHSPWSPDDPAPEMVYVPDVTRDPGLADHRDRLAREDIRSLVFLPVVTRAGLRGKFMLYASTVDPWNPSALDHARHIARHIGFVFDRIGTEERLRDSLRRLEILAHQVPQGILFEDENDIIAFANHRLTELFGLPDPEELVGRHCVGVAESILETFADPERFLSTIDRIKAGRVPVSGVEVTLSDGRILESAYVPIAGRGPLIGSLWTYEDVTSRRRLEDQLARMRGTRRMSTFADSIAHDFNNTLTSISGYAELLGDRHGDDSETRALLDELQTVIAQSAALTRSLLTFARGQKGRRERIPIEDFLRAAIAPYRRLLEPEVTVSFESRLPDAVIEAVPAQLTRVIENLVVNARDAMPEGGRLTITLIPHGAPATLDAPDRLGAPPPDTTPPGTDTTGWAAIEVRDTGCGMDRDTRASIFEPFFTTKSGGRGLGLGLASAWRIITDLGGTIDVTSQPGQGSTFRVVLPLGASGGAAGDRAPALPSADAHVSPGDGWTVLLVDDDEGVRRTLVTALAQQGYDVLDAADGRQALDILVRRAGSIDALITDVRMPGMDGPTLVAEVRDRGWTMPVVIISGFVEEAPRTLADVTMLQKPFRPAELIALLPGRV